jgi:hypothetical protein
VTATPSVYIPPNQGRREDLEEIAQLAHEDHDPFQPRLCPREVCRRIDALLNPDD